MAVDASKLKRRHNLGAPPTEGTPGIDEGSALAPQAEKPLPEWPTSAIQRFLENRDRSTREAAAPEPAPTGSAEPAPRPAQAAPTDPSGTGKAASTNEPEPPDPEPHAEPAPAFAARAFDGEDNLELRLRSRVEADGRFRLVETPASWNTKETAFIVWDMWDSHHCLNAVRREKEMAPIMERVLRAARARGGGRRDKVRGACRASAER